MEAVVRRKFIARTTLATVAPEFQLGKLDKEELRKLKVGKGMEIKLGV